MTNPRRKALPADDLTKARERRSAVQLAYRAEVLEAIANPFFPDQLVDQITGEPTITGEGEGQLRQVFRVLGVTKLDPLSKDFATVLNTWSVLMGKGVGKQLRALSLFGPVIYNAEAPDWHLAFKAYVDALWAGDAAAVASAAEDLCELAP